MLMKSKYKLIVTIVNKEKAKKVIQASKKAGARGGTTLLGTGFRIDDKTRFLGIPLEREREIILTLVENHLLGQVMKTIVKSVQLNKPRHGISFIINTELVTGINQPSVNQQEGKFVSEGGDDMMDNQQIQYDLIMTIINKGDAEKVVDASKRAGAEGGTILHGRGTGIHEQAKLFNIIIEPEKELVLTLINREKTAQVLAAIEEEAKLNQPGKGIAFVLQVEKTVGINHVLNKMVNEKWENRDN